MQHPPCFFTISNRLLLGGNCVKEKKYLDFLGGLVLLMLSVIIIIASVLMHIKSGEVFYLSPGLMPMILGIALLFCSLFYFAESLKDGGFSAVSAKQENGFMPLFLIRQRIPWQSVLSLWLCILFYL